MDEFGDPVLTKTDLNSKEYMDGSIPMRNGRIVDNGPETPDSDDYSDSKGKT